MDRVYRMGRFICHICGEEFANDIMAIYEDGAAKVPVCRDCDRGMKPTDVAVDKKEAQPKEPEFKAPTFPIGIAAYLV